MLSFCFLEKAAWKLRSKIRGVRREKKPVAWTWSNIFQNFYNFIYLILEIPSTSPYFWYKPPCSQRVSLFFEGVFDQPHYLYKKSLQMHSSVLASHKATFSSTTLALNLSSGLDCTEVMLSLLVWSQPQHSHRWQNFVSRLHFVNTSALWLVLLRYKRLLEFVLLCQRACRLDYKLESRQYANSSVVYIAHPLKKLECFFRLADMIHARN